MLHQYHIDFSQLSPDEKAALSDRIDNISFTGIQWEQGFQSGTFFIEENFAIFSASCEKLHFVIHVVRLQRGFSFYYYAICFLVFSS